MPNVSTPKTKSRVLFPAAPTDNGEHHQDQCQGGGPHRGFGGEEVECGLDNRHHREEGQKARDGVTLQSPPCFAGGVVVIMMHAVSVATTPSRHRR